MWLGELIVASFLIACVIGVEVAVSDVINLVVLDLYADMAPKQFPSQNRKYFSVVFFFVSRGLIFLFLKFFYLQ